MDKKNKKPHSYKWSFNTEYPNNSTPHMKEDIDDTLLFMNQGIRLRKAVEVILEFDPDQLNDELHAQYSLLVAFFLMEMTLLIKESSSC